MTAGVPYNPGSPPPAGAPAPPSRPPAVPYLGPTRPASTGTSPPQPVQADTPEEALHQELAGRNPPIIMMFLGLFRKSEISGNDVTLFEYIFENYLAGSSMTVQNEFSRPLKSKNGNRMNLMLCRLTSQTLGNNAPMKSSSGASRSSLRILSSTFNFPNII